MRLPVRPLVLLALLELAALGWLAHGDPAPNVTPAQAANFEGQGPVRISGLATSVHVSAEGTTTMQVSADGYALDVQAPGPVDVAPGAWVEAEGRVLRSAGRLTLQAARATDVRVVPGPAPEQPSWQQVAADPAAWHGRSIRLSGILDHGVLADKDGHHLATGPGPWPGSGAVTAAGFIAYAPACLCERFTAATVATTELA